MLESAKKITSALVAVNSKKGKSVLKFISEGDEAKSQKQIIQSTGIHQVEASKYCSQFALIGLLKVTRSGKFKLYQLNPEKIKRINTLLGEISLELSPTPSL